MKWLKARSLGLLFATFLVSCEGAREKPCPSVRDARAFIVGSDRNGDHSLTSDEFRASIERNSSEQYPDAFLTSTFQAYDTDGDGHLTIQEMQNLARKTCREA